MQWSPATASIAPLIAENIFSFFIILFYCVVDADPTTILYICGEYTSIIRICSQDQGRSEKEKKGEINTEFSTNKL